MKKFLALVLALVMTMSLVTISAGAEFTDADEINYDEAVEVMTAVKVVDGLTDGSFNPQGGLTRGAAAKIICNMILGPTTASALSADAAPFVDVAADSTYAGYIAYCAKEGIVSGYADGTFKPAAPLNGYAFMKMLLGALGYDKDIEGYEGANWSINVAKRALNIGLDAGLADTFVGTKNVTREEALLFAFNTMKATMVDYGTRTNITVGDVSVSTQADASEVEDGANDYTANSITGDTTMQFCEKYFPNLKVFGTIDGLARPANEWKIKNASVGTFAEEADYTAYVDATNNTLGKVVDSFSKKFIDNTATVYVNGVATTANAAARGNLVEIYMDADNANLVDRIVVTYKTVAKLTNDAATKEDGVDTLVKVPGVAGLTAYNSVNTTEVVHGYADLKKDDIVMYYVDNNGEYFIEKAESFTGLMTKSSGSAISTYYNLTIDGAAYKTSGQNNTLNDNNTDIDPTSFYSAEATWYLDDAGFVVWAEGIDNTVLAYVLDATTDTDAWSTDTFYAKLVMMDGTVATVETAKQYDAAQDTSDTTLRGGDLINHFVKYSVKDDEYTLTDVAAYDYNVTKGQVNADISDFRLIKGNPAVKLNNNGIAEDWINANADTVFFVRDYTAANVEKDSYTAFTGYASVPSMDFNISANNLTAASIVSAYVGTDGYAEYVVIDPMKNVAGLYSATDLFYVTNSTVYSHYDVDDGVYYYTVAGIKNGVDGDIEFSNLPSVAAGSAYTVSNYDKNGRIDSHSGALTTTGKYVVGTGVSAENATTVKLAGTAYAADANTVVYYVDKDGVVSTIAVADIVTDGSDAFVAVKKDITGVDQYKIETLFIREVNVTAPVVTTALADQTNVAASITAPSVTVTSPADGTLSYAWYVNGVVVAGQTTNTLSYFTSSTAAGTYEVECVITNTSSADASEVSAVSQICTVTVVAP